MVAERRSSASKDRLFKRKCADKSTEQQRWETEAKQCTFKPELREYIHPGQSYYSKAVCQTEGKPTVYYKKDEQEDIKITISVNPN
jgi:hypothetical protein